MGNSTNYVNETDTLNIIRYNNRKLYSKNDSGYVTLEEIASEIQRGRNVVVTDNKTNKDITNKVLRSVALKSKYVLLTNADLFSIIQNRMNDIL